MRGSQSSPKYRSHLKDSRHQKVDMNQVPYSEPINIRRYHTKVSVHGNLAAGICARFD